MNVSPRFTTTFSVLILGVIFILAPANYAKMKRYAIKQACIEYKVEGSMQQGSEVLYFDDYGAIEAKYEEKVMKVGPIKQETSQVTFLEGAMQYVVNLKDRTGTKMENSMLKQHEGEDLNKVGEKMLKQMGGQIVGTGTVLGKKCDIWEIKSANSKAWVWNGITLKTEVNMMGMTVSIEATKITDTFDKKKLQRPQDIEYKDMGNMGDFMKKFKGN